MSEAKLDIIRLFAIEGDAEPKPDIACCSSCNGRFPVSECLTEPDGDWETGYYSVHVCPKCEDGGCVDGYDMTPECAEKWNEWKANDKAQL
jgi:hypothetical protein